MTQNGQQLLYSHFQLIYNFVQTLAVNKSILQVFSLARPLLRLTTSVHFAYSLCHARLHCILATSRYPPVLSRAAAAAIAACCRRRCRQRKAPNTAKNNNNQILDCAVVYSTQWSVLHNLQPTHSVNESNRIQLQSSSNKVLQWALFKKQKKFLKVS